MNALDVEKLSAGYGNLVVLRELSLYAAEGEFISIIGANGAGKTTLLRTISGLIKRRSGEIRAFGKRLGKLSSAEIVRAGISQVPEGRQLFPLMTVRENLESGADYLDEARKKLADSRGFVYSLFPRLAERERQLAGTLSGGEQQMLAIGRALMSRPKVLLVDEPSLGLAPALSQTMFAALGAINAEGVTVVLVEQNVRQSLKLSDRAYVLENGEIRKSAKGSDLLDDPEVRAAYLSI